MGGDSAHQPLGDRDEHHGGDQRGHGQALVQGPLDVAGPGFDRERADDRGDDRDAAEHQRVERDRRGLVEGQHAEQHHGHGGDRVGLEQVGRHAGAVADVVADVVGDHRRVTGVVLGDPGLDLADEVGADVGALGEDAAAEAGEHRDQRAAEAESDQGVDRVARALARDPGEDSVVGGDADEGEADDEHAGNRTAAEGDVQGLGDAAAGGLGDAGVGSHRDVHADVAGGRRERGADQKADRHADVLQRDEQDEDDDADAGDRRVLAVQIGPGALLHGRRDLLHTLVAGRQCEQGSRGRGPVNDGGRRAHKRDQDAVVRQKARQEGPPEKLLVEKRGSALETAKGAAAKTRRPRHESRARV